MTIIMTAKNQITIPKKITAILGLKKGSIFNIEISRNRIELVPLEMREKVFTEAEYRKLDILSAKEAGKVKPVDRMFINNLKKGKI